MLYRQSDQGQELVHQMLMTGPHNLQLSLPSKNEIMGQSKNEECPHPRQARAANTHFVLGGNCKLGKESSYCYVCSSCKKNPSHFLQQCCGREQHLVTHVELCLAEISKGTITCILQLGAEFVIHIPLQNHTVLCVDLWYC